MKKKSECKNDINICELEGSPFVSVIIPVYNTAPYLDEAIESVVNQTLTNIEIICINDGSTDASLDILEKWTKYDDRISVYNQSNRGLSASRNRGISIAKGKTIFFMDSDDLLASDALYIAYDELTHNDLDVLCFNAINFKSDDHNTETIVETLHRNEYKGVFKGLDLYEAMNDNREYRSVVWLYLFNYEFLKNNNILFIDGILYEDRPFTMEVYIKANRMSCIPDVLYKRRIRSDSITFGNKTLRNACGYLISYLRINELMQIYSERFSDKQREILIDALELLDLKEAVRMYNEITMTSSDMIEDPIIPHRYFGLILKMIYRIHDDRCSHTMMNLDSNSDPVLLKHIYRLKADRDQARYELNATRSSFSCRLGVKMTWLPRQIIRLFKSGNTAIKQYAYMFNFATGRPVVSVVVPVFNATKHVSFCVKQLKRQTFSNFEVIIIDDHSDDNTKDIVNRAISDDSRFRMINLPCRKGAGAARNTGIDEAKGKYIVFLDVDDVYSKDLISVAVRIMQEYKSDIVSYDFYRLFDGKKYRISTYVNENTEYSGVFSYKNYPDNIMSIVNPTPWNKMYALSFIKKNNLRYDELLSTNDITFAAMSVATASRISYVRECLYGNRCNVSGSITEKKKSDCSSMIMAVKSTYTQAAKLPYFDIIKKSVCRFVVDNLIYAMKNYVSDWNAPNAMAFYNSVKEILCSEWFMDESVLQSLEDRNLQIYLAIRERSYEEFVKAFSKRIVISMTSYPDRIDKAYEVVESLLIQSHPADDIVLWLSIDQFKEYNKKLPKKIEKYVADGKLTIRWVNNDIGPHKKYFYALKEYSDSIVITVDDDLLYPIDMVESLFVSYLRFPAAVSARRVHLIAYEKDGTIMPYKQWPRETDACVHVPNHQLIATGGAGTLYPPLLFDTSLINEDEITKTCLYADDLCLKMMELHSKVPIVLSEKYSSLVYVDNTQDTGLYKTNLEMNKNDEYLDNIINWYDARFGEGTFSRLLVGLSDENKPSGMEAVCLHYQELLRRSFELTLM